MKNIKGKVVDLKSTKGWILAEVSNGEESVKFLTKGALVFDRDKAQASFLFKKIKINDEVAVTYSKELKAGMYSMDTLLVSNGVTIAKESSKENVPETSVSDNNISGKKESKSPPKKTPVKHKKDSWEEKMVKITFGNYMNVAATIVGSTAKSSPNVEKVGEMALEMVIPCNTLRNSLIEEYPTKDPNDVGAKLGSAFNAVAYKGMPIEKLLEKAEEWIKANYKYEDMLFNGEVSPKEKDEPTSDVSSEGKDKETSVEETPAEKGKPESYDFSGEGGVSKNGVESSSFLEDFE